MLTHGADRSQERSVAPLPRTLKAKVAWRWNGFELRYAVYQCHRQPDIHKDLCDGDREAFVFIWGAIMIEGRTSLSIAMVVVGAIGTVIGVAVVNRPIHTDADASVERALVDAANQYNKMLPVMFDSETRGDTSIPQPPNTLIFHLTLVKRTNDELDADAIVKQLRPKIINNYKTTDGMKTLRDAGVTLVYDFYDKNGTFITEIVVKTSDLN
jgi:hypothetical protein